MNIQEVLEYKRGVSYKGSLAVFLSDVGEEFHICGNTPFYMNAFSYALVLSGRAMLSVDGNEYAVDAHSLCIISPLHLTYFLPQTDDFCCFFLSVSKSFIDSMAVFNVQHRIVRGLRMHSQPLLRITDDEKEELSQCLQDIKRQIERTEHRYHVYLMQNSLIRFYLEVDQIVDSREEQNPPENAQTRYAEILRDFTTLLMAHFKSEHTVPFYAESLHITPQYLTRIVKGQTGQTVNGFINEMLYSEARNLLSQSELSVQQIAAELCFSDASAFTKFFKKQAGQTPLKFREEVTGK